jgi:hypothetical protein
VAKSLARLREFAAVIDTCISAPRPDTVRTAGLRPCFAVAVLLAVSTLPVFAVADLPGGARGTVAAVFAPGTDRATALAAVAEAGGLVVRAGGWGSVLVARSDEAGFARRLRRAGAWLVVDPQSAAGCLIAGPIERS